MNDKMRIDLPNRPIQREPRGRLVKFMGMTTCLLVLATAAARAAGAGLVPERVVVAVPDRQDCVIPDRVQLGGWLGARMAVNESNRLVTLDSDRLLEGYRKRPGRQSWDGEHVGKWLHAGTLAWVNAGDPALRKKLDYVAAELVKCQLPDGYLGTYLDKDRWTEWDVWAHKYNLIGLLTYLRYTGNLGPLPACRRMADLLFRTFGDEPGKRDIITAGTHVGLAPTSVLEPMVLLYRLTGEPRYLDFCKYILRAWEQPNGPKLISTLLTQKRVDRVGDAKAYEMLSCLNGALEYYRTIGDPQILQACLNAWRDIVQHRLYITGASSYEEVFHEDYDLPNVAKVGETCVTVTWLQFNAQLLRLTGEARFAEQLEHVVLNQLLGAQQPDGAGWGYFVQMEGRKSYLCYLDGQCCLSSGPRGIALVPTFAITTDADGLVLNLYDQGSAKMTLRDGGEVALRIETLYPAEDRIRITLDPGAPRAFAVKVRLPAWCSAPSARINGKRADIRPGADGYAALRRQWKSGDRLELNWKQEPGAVIGDHINQGKLALRYGPLVLAADTALLPSQVDNLAGVVMPSPGAGPPALKSEAASGAFKTWPGARLFATEAVARETGARLELRLVPFADAGALGTQYKVWLPLMGKPAGNLLLDGTECFSRGGNLTNSIIDEDVVSPVVTFNNQPAREDWFAVLLEKPVVFRRVVFFHGRNFHDGGWFDTSAGKPKVQVQREKNGPWETVGELDNYPATRADKPTGLWSGLRFTCLLPAPVKAVSVRVAGVPACGDNPKQAFASCAELQAFAE